MLNRIDTWLLLAVLFGLLVCCMAALIGKNRLLEKDIDDLKHALTSQRNLANAYQAERDMVLARAKSHCSYWILRRDERIEGLEAENRALRDVMVEV